LIVFSGDSKERRLTGSKSSRSGKERSNRSRSRDRKDKDKGESEELPFDHTKLDKVRQSFEYYEVYETIVLCEIEK